MRIGTKKTQTDEREARNHTHVGAVEGVGEENLPPSTRRLVGLVLRNEDGTVEVRLHRDNGKGRDGDRGARVGDSVHS